MRRLSSTFGHGSPGAGSCRCAWLPVSVLSSMASWYCALNRRWYPRYCTPSRPVLDFCSSQHIVDADRRSGRGLSGLGPMTNDESREVPSDRCEGCGQVTPNYDIVHYGSIDSGYRDLCGGDPGAREFTEASSCMVRARCARRAGSGMGQNDPPRVRAAKRAVNVMAARRG